MTGMCRCKWLGTLAVGIIFWSMGGWAAAAQVRFHYVPVDACGNSALQPSGPVAGVGERIRWFGIIREPYANQPRPTHMVTFRQPYSARTISVPMAFPEGTPRVANLRDRVVYSYGSYTVEARFLPDGSVDVIYDAGFLRAP